MIRPWRGPKPPLGAEINWGHPFAQGLTWCMLHNESGGPARDLIRRQPTDTTQPTWGVATHGTTTEWAMSNTASAAINFTTGAWTVAVYLNLATDVGNSQYVQAFERRNYVNESNNQGYDISAFPPNDGTSPNTWNFQTFNNNAAASYRLSASVTPTAGDWWVVGTTDGTTRRIYLQGIERANTASSPSAASNTGGVLQSYTFGNAGLARAYLHLAWARCLTPAHVASLAAEPFAFIARPVRRYYSAPAGGGQPPALVSRGRPLALVMDY